MVRVKHRIGRYRLIAPIGAGGFSTVYRALDEENDQEVAIKVLAENHSLVPDTRRRFVEEFNLRKTVESPFIAKMYEVGTTDAGQPFMVLELADRGDLRRRVEEFRRSHQLLTRDDLMMLARHLTEALTALHEADIVHRDVSPGNILIRSRPQSGARQGSPERHNVTLLEPGERFLLADLGHAKDLVRSSGFTAGGGTQGFAAPEQRDDVTVVDHRADIFSATAIVEWAAHDGLFAERLEPFFDTGLAAEPDGRYPTMAEWYDAISDAVGSGDADDAAPKRRFRRQKAGPTENTRLPVPAPGPQPSHATPEPELDQLEPEPRRRSMAGKATAVVLALSLAGGLAAAGLFLVDDADPSNTDSSAEPDSSTTTVADATATTGSTSTSTTGPLVVQPSDEESDDTEEAGSESGGEEPTDGQTDGMPAASIESPAEDAVVDGDLIITGIVDNADGVSHVEMTIRNLGTSRFWTPDDGPTLTDEPFRVEVAPDDQGDPNRVRFGSIVPAIDLETGEYLIQVWAVTNGDDQEQADPVSRRFVFS